MDNPSRDTLLSILQQRMDKCTTEQFWAIAALTTLYAAIITKREIFLPGIPKWVVAIALSTTAFYGLFFVFHRHKAFYDYRKDFAELLEQCSFAPRFMKEARSAWEVRQFTGLLFYCAWIFGGYAVTMYVLFR